MPTVPAIEIELKTVRLKLYFSQISISRPKLWTRHLCTSRIKLGLSNFDLPVVDIQLTFRIYEGYFESS